MDDKLTPEEREAWNRLSIEVLEMAIGKEIAKKLVDVFGRDAMAERVEKLAHGQDTEQKPVRPYQQPEYLVPNPEDVKLPHPHSKQTLSVDLNHLLLPHSGWWADSRKLVEGLGTPQQRAEMITLLDPKVNFEQELAAQVAAAEATAPASKEADWGTRVGKSPLGVRDTVAKILGF